MSDDPRKLVERLEACTRVHATEDCYEAATTIKRLLAENEALREDKECLDILESGDLEVRDRHKGPLPCDVCGIVEEHKWAARRNNGDLVAFAPSLRLAIRAARREEKP